MATRTEARLADASALGTTYAIVGAAVPSSHTWNMLINMANKTSGQIAVRLYIADSSWSSGEPTGGTLKIELAYDLKIAAGEIAQISGIVANAGEKIVARSDTASSLSVSISGVDIT